MLQKPRRLLALLLLAALTLCLAGCGGSGAAGSAGGDAENIRLLVWAPSEDQAQASGEWLQTCCNNFAALHPEWNITFNYGVADEATSASTVAYDPEDSADVFMYANDNITVLTDAKALAKIGEDREVVVGIHEYIGAGLRVLRHLGRRRRLVCHSVDEFNVILRMQRGERITGFLQPLPAVNRLVLGGGPYHQADMLHTSLS